MAKRVLLTGFSALMLMMALNLTGADKTWKDASVQVGDIRTHYLEGGSGDRHLVFIPGLTMTADVFQEQIPYFAARGFHVIAIDPRSQGLTSKTESGNTYHQQAADLHAFLEKLRLEHCTLIGWAAGVAALLDYISSPEALQPDRLVFINWAPAGFDQKDYPSRAALQQARDLAIAMEDDRAKATEQLIHGMFKSQQAGPLYKSLTDASLRTPTGTAIALLFDLISADRRPAFAQISVPTLIVTTQDNQVIGEFIQSKIPGAQLKVIPEVGHALFLEKPQAFNQALEDFLGKQ